MLNNLSVQYKSLENDCVKKEKELDDTRMILDKMVNSKGWKFLEKLRTLRRKIF